ncbi:hypothetical protein VTJ83DRAFT_4910 [Remersonia thermophila]|uniref:Zn(2)-C6 fungal-type domain-containing protein n=1 Tax=Remersonia thermophila TaxID=72144 RepID=A0ABR4DBD6_9PEZI
MGDYYHHFLTSMVGVGGPPNHNMMDPSGQIPPPPLMQMGAAPMPGPYQNLGYFTGFPEPIMFNAAKAQRSRRKSAPGLDHIKHRRTRSGCYTCRSRRVKCDETHPICERCRKGKRDCVYPEPPAPKGSKSNTSNNNSSNNDSKESSTGPSQQASPTSSRDDEDDETEQDTKLDPIMDEDEDEPQSATSTTSAPNFPPPRRSSITSSLGRPRGTAPGPRQGSETPSLDGKSSSPGLSVAGATSSYTPAAAHPDMATMTTPTGRPDWTFLPHELQFYLGYFYDKITYFHYGMVNDADDFFRSIMPNLAMTHEALLYAMVGFAAYHHVMKNPNGKIHEFLQYYSRSVRLLLDCLSKEKKYSLGTLFTILQLATIEEFLGDWINLMGHQKAALEVLSHVFTPQTAVQTPAGRMAVIWYGRFDLFTSVMGSLKPSLPREWYSEQVDYFKSRAAAEPHNLGWKVESCSAELRVLSIDMALLYARNANRELSEEEYAAEHARLGAALEEWKAGWDPALTDPAYRVDEFPNAPAPDPEDIVNPQSPAAAASAAAAALGGSGAGGGWGGGGPGISDEDRARLREHAYAVCQISEAVELWPHSPPGSLFILQSCLALATLSLPKDQKHCMWLRRKFAMLESIGYITPVATRQRIAELLGDGSVARWWLPNDEGFTQLLRNVRDIADERNAVAAATQQESLMQIRRVFSRMNLGQDREGDATSTTAEGS